VSTLSGILDDLTVEGDLYERLPENAVRCFACGHRCLIREGKRGICQVRFNQGGELRVPWGYVAALQSDPIEKKPFFHVLPGSNALTFGMLGCDFHCGYCFTGDMVVITDRGPRTLAECFSSSEKIQFQPDGQVGFPSELYAIAASGQPRRVKAVFKHPYRGPLLVLQPYYLPPLQCTPDHRVYATDHVAHPPQLMRAENLTEKHYLAIPRRYSFSFPQTISTAEIVTNYQKESRIDWKSSGEEIQNEPTWVGQTTPPGVAAAEFPAELLVKSLVGVKASEKQIPAAIFSASRILVEAFLDAVIDADGHRYASGKISVTTISHSFAHGIAWLALKLGYLPSLYEVAVSPDSDIRGKSVAPAPRQYMITWHRKNSLQRKVVETNDYHLVPLRGIQKRDFDGYVFNMEVEEEHNYLAGFFLVSNCQNWVTSQAMRDPASDASIDHIRKIAPKGMVDLAHRTRASVVVSSYNEPLITSEWAVGIFKEAKAAGLMCAYVSNGNNTDEVLVYIRPYISAYKIDLKSMQEKNYRKLGGVLQNVLDGIKRAYDSGLWVEVVTLTIPGFNDSSEEMWDAARFIASVSKEIPWHVTAFHKDYKMTDPDNTTAATLLRVAEIGQEAGLHYVYAGNLPGRVKELEDTFCHNCRERLIHRSGYTILEYRLTASGACPKCGTKVPGVWPQDPAGVRLNGEGMPIPVV
jgi:pyruvate formate lyase activating enzyme